MRRGQSGAVFPWTNSAVSKMTVGEDDIDLALPERKLNENGSASDSSLDMHTSFGTPI
jgi:hypothetical protein